MRIGLAAVAVIIPLVACPASAAPSFLGYTGVLATPNTALVGEDSVDLAIHNVPNADFFRNGASLTPFTASFGLADNVELTAGLFAVENGGDDEFTFHLKYGILSEPEDEVSLAVGLVDILEELGDSVPLYLALGKDLGSDLQANGPVPVTIGLLFADDPGVLMGDEDVDEVQFFASVTGDVNEHVTLMGEVLEEEFNWGARFNVTDDVHIDVGSIFDEFMWGVSYHTML